MREWTLEQFGEELSSKAAVPGGGGVSALTGAHGCALGSMVANLTVGKKKYAAVEARVCQLRERADALREELLRLTEEDARVFAPLAKAYGMPRGTEQERARREAVMEAALREASLVPLQVMEKAAEMLAVHAELAEVGSRLAASDVGVGVQLCRSAALGASMNVYINTKMMKDRALAEERNARARKLARQVADEADRIFGTVLGELE